MYEVLLEVRAERDLKRVGRDDFQRIIDHARGLGETPRPAGCRKLAGSKSDWRIRVGDYRIVYEIDDKSRVVRVMRVRHRREVY